MSRKLCFAVMLALFFLVGCHEEELTFNVSLSGNQEVPPVTSEASASAIITLKILHSDTDLLEFDENGELSGISDDDELVLSGNLDISMLTDVQAAHIHQGKIGTNGPVAFSFADNGDGTMSIAETEITVDLANELLAELWYINVHTLVNPPGEVRGQIVDDNTSVITFNLEGEQEVPAIETEATGYGYATYNNVTTALDLKVLTSGVDDAVAAHLHEGFIGQNGAIVFGLEQDPDNVTLWKSPENTVLDNEVATRLLNGGHYINVHTPANPSGEIRGQILSKDFVLFTFPLTGAQEVPPVDTEAEGSGYATFNQITKELVARIVTSGADDATAAHIHESVSGENGGVIVALNQSEDNVAVWMTPDGIVLDEDTATELLSGGHYINVHTPANPAGEIRGQIE